MSLKKARAEHLRLRDKDLWTVPPEHHKYEMAHWSVHDLRRLRAPIFRH
jgi:hypothetical protein